MINKERIYINVTGDSTSIPKKPILVSSGSLRSSGSILTSLNSVLSWNVTDSAEYYTVAVRDVDTGGLVLNKTNVVGVSLSVSSDLTARHKYYCGITACNDAGYST